MLFVKNFAIDHCLSKITWVLLKDSLSIYPKVTKIFRLHRCVACEVRVNLNYSTELHFTIFYWLKSRTWHCKSNRACAKITGKPGKQQTWRLILRWRKCTRLSRKSGYFQHWLEYSSAFEVLEAREKLNIVPSSWETFENLRKCWPSLHESKLRLNTCCGRCSCWISSGTESWLNQRQLEQTKSMPVVCFKESLVERTVSKENSKSMQSKELFACSSGLSTLQRGTLQ